MPSDGTNIRKTIVNNVSNRVSSSISSLMSNTQYTITVAASQSDVVVGATSNQTNAITRKYLKKLTKK